MKFTSQSRWIACPEGLSAPIVRKKMTLAPDEVSGEICISGLGSPKTTLTLPSGTLSLCLTYERGGVSVECESAGDLKVKVAR